MIRVKIIWMCQERDLPLAEPGREQSALEIFPIHGLTPEEYAARESHRWACFSFADYRYRDPELSAWIQRLGSILFCAPGAPSVEELRAQYLTPAERQEIEREADQAF